MPETRNDASSRPDASATDLPGDEHVVLVPTFVARPGAGKELERRLLDLASISSQEDGCIEYTVHVDVHDPDRFVLYERWTTQEVLDRHDRTKHVTEFVADLPSLIAAPMQRWELRRRTPSSG